MDIEHLGQVFTPAEIVGQMLALRRNFGRVLEPSCGAGAFYKVIRDCVAIELDPLVCPPGANCTDFFDYPTEEKFDTIIGNPPYVRYQDIAPATKKIIESKSANFNVSAVDFDRRSNLYLFFIAKCIEHLTPHGELIFITPREFLKATSARKLNEFIYNSGTITDLIDLADQRVFDGATPDCIIFRFEKGNFTRKTAVATGTLRQADRRLNELRIGTFSTKFFSVSNGQLLFTSDEYQAKFSDLFYVKVGGVSGMDSVFASDEFGTHDFVCSETRQTGATRRMIYNSKCNYLERHKAELLARRIRHFDENNWWMWGRNCYISSAPRIYVNMKTRVENPFFLHPCNYFDGSILGIFPHDTSADLNKLCEKLNSIDWAELGFRAGGRFLFSQRALENTKIMIID